MGVGAVLLAQLAVPLPSVRPPVHLLLARVRVHQRSVLQRAPPPLVQVPAPQRSVQLQARLHSVPQPVHPPSEQQRAHLPLARPPVHRPLALLPTHQPSVPSPSVRHSQGCQPLVSSSPPLGQVPTQLRLDLARGSAASVRLPRLHQPLATQRPPRRRPSARSRSAPSPLPHLPLAVASEHSPSSSSKERLGGPPLQATQRQTAYSTQARLQWMAAAGVPPQGGHAGSASDDAALRAVCARDVGTLVCKKVCSDRGRRTLYLCMCTVYVMKLTCWCCV